MFFDAEFIFPAALSPHNKFWFNILCHSKKKKVQMYDYVCYVASINSLVPKILTKNDENSLLCNITLNGIMTGLDTNQQHILF